VRSFAEVLGEENQANLLDQTLQDEKQADAVLTRTPPTFRQIKLLNLRVHKVVRTGRDGICDFSVPP
jgi:hypothetical protein